MKQKKCCDGNQSKLYLIVVAVILVLMVALTLTTNKSYTVDQQKMALEYTELSKNNQFKYVKIDDVLKVFENGTAVVFFGFPECPWCQKTAPILSEAASKAGVKEILYYNPMEIRAENTPKYQQLVKILNKYLRNDDNNQKRLFVPDIYVVKKGEIVAQANELAKPDDKVETYYTDKRTKELVDIYEKALKKL